MLAYIQLQSFVYSNELPVALQASISFLTAALKNKKGPERLHVRKAPARHPVQLPGRPNGTGSNVQCVACRH